MPTWGCDACYLFGRNRNHPIGRCAACTRELPLRKLYCRLCWCQARLDAKAVTRSPAQAPHLAPHLPCVRHHQLFFADLDLMAKATQAGCPRPGPEAAAAGPATPADGWIQPPLFEIRRDFTRFDRRRHADLANPSLVDARHAARNLGETRGWTPSVTADVDRALVILLSGHVLGETIHHSEVAGALRLRGLSVGRTITVLDHIGLLDDDRTSTFDAWLNRRLHGLTPGIHRDVDSWLRTLHDGGPRTRARANSTVYGYLNETYPVLADWSSRYDHLREVNRDDVLAVRDAVRGKQRENRIVALRSLFRHCRTRGTIFRDPTIRIRISRPTSGPILPLQPDDVDQAVAAAQTDPAVRVVLALAAVHAARPKAIRELRVDDVDLGNRRLSIAGHVRPLDGLTHQVILDWLHYRRERWPNTANPHLIITRHTALDDRPASRWWATEPVRRLTATLERLRVDRQLDEALTHGPDPLHLAAVFGLDEKTAIRYANAARDILETEAERHAIASSLEPKDPAALPDTSGPLGSR